MPESVALSLQNITVRYGDVLAVDRLSLEIQRGEVFGLIGPNGSGKSSTLSVAAGVIAPTIGRVSADGVCRRTRPTDYASRIGLVPQETAIYDELTARENLSFFGRLYGLGRRELQNRVGEVLHRVGMTLRADEPLARLSGGMRQRINLAVALLHGPTVLLLDEPTAALDPASRDALFTTIDGLRDDGHAILLTTHSLDEAEQRCDRVAVLRHGSLVAMGRPSELAPSSLADPTIYGQLQSYLSGDSLSQIRERLAADVECEVTGRRVRLSARTSESLGQALAVLLAEGVEFASFRTPPAGLERLLRGGVSDEVSVRS